MTKLRMLKSSHLAQQYEMQDKVRGCFPNKIKETQLYIECLEADLPVLAAHPAKEGAFSMTVMGTAYTDRKEAGAAIVAACRLMDDPGKEIALGEYRGFPMKLCFSGSKFKVTMKQHLTYTAELSDDVVGNTARINNALEKIPQSLERHREKLECLHKELESAKEEAGRPFAQEKELAEKSARLAELNAVLDYTEKAGGQGPQQDVAAPVQDGTVQQDAAMPVRDGVVQQGNAMPVQDGERRQDQGEKARETQQGMPAQKNSGKPDIPGRKPSILQKLKEYQPPARAQAKAGRGREMEAV